MHTFTLMHIHCTTQQRGNRMVYMFMCNIIQKTLGSYIKFSLGHKPGPVVTLSGRVPNDIHHLGSNKAVVSTEDRPFWSICWAGEVDGSRGQTSWSAHRSDLWWTPVNCNWLRGLSSVEFLCHFKEQFSSLLFCCVWLRGGLEADVLNFKPQSWTMQVQFIIFVHIVFDTYSKVRETHMYFAWLVSFEFYVE